MKRINKLPLIAMSLFLVACAPTSEPTISEPTTDPTSNPTTTVPTTDPTTSDPTTGPTISEPDNSEYVAAVESKVSSFNLLKSFITELGDTPVVKVNFTNTTSSTYNNKETQIETMFRSDEVYSVTTNIERKTSGDKIEKETLYLGVVDGIFYDAILNTQEMFSNVKRYKISDTKEVYQTDILDATSVNEKLQEAKTSNNLSCLTAYGYWETIFANENFVESSYDLTINEDTARVVVKGYQETGSKIAVTFIANFDKDVRLESGTLSVDRYTATKWDSETHAPIAGAQVTSRQKISLDGVEYGEPLKTSNRTMIDLSKYFVESLSEGIKISNFVTDPYTGMAVYSEDNEVFANQPVDCPVDYIKENKLFLPETALDLSTLYITGSSVENFLKSDGYGWVINGKVGDTATLYIGNSFQEKLAEVEVTVVKSPIKNDPMINPNVFGVSGDNYTYDPNGVRPSLTINGGSPVVMAISTYNKGPFDSYPIGFWTSSAGIVSAKLCENQSQYYESHSSSAIYFEITPLASGSVVFAVTNSSTGEGHFEIQITVNL